MPRQVILAPEGLVAQVALGPIDVQTHAHSLVVVLRDDVAVALTDLGVTLSADGTGFGLDELSELAPGSGGGKISARFVKGGGIRIGDILGAEGGGGLAVGG